MKVRHRELDAAKEKRTSKEDDAKDANNKDGTFKTPLEKKLHSPREAWFTLDNMKNYPRSGLIDGLFASLCLASAGLILQNFREEGFRVSFAYWFSLVYHEAGMSSTLLLLLYMPVHLIIAFGLEKAMAHRLLPERAGLFLEVINWVCQFSYPIVGLWFLRDTITIASRGVVCVFNLTVLLKLWSFIHMCWWARSMRNGAGKASGDSNATEYPNNLTVGSYVRFLFAPTVCYELDYPLRPKIDWWNFLLVAAALIASVVIKAAIVDQWLVPAMGGMMGPYVRGEYFHTAEVLMKVAVPMYVVTWFLAFILFHFNIAFWGELTRFADNHGYDDWWDAEDLGVFFHRWNIPINRWCNRHVYQPLMRRGWNKTAAKYATFFVSGLFHDYVLIIPGWMFSGYYTGVLFVQGPFCDFSEWLRKKRSDDWGRAFNVVDRVMGVPLGCFLTLYHYHKVYNPDYIAALKNASTL